MRRERVIYLPPAAVPLRGLAIVVGASVFWAVTGRESALLIGAGMTLVSLGAVHGVRIALTEAGVVRPPREGDG